MRIFAGEVFHHVGMAGIVTAAEVRGGEFCKTAQQLIRLVRGCDDVFDTENDLVFFGDRDQFFQRGIQPVVRLLKIERPVPADIVPYMDRQGFRSTFAAEFQCPGVVFQHFLFIFRRRVERPDRIPWHVCIGKLQTVVRRFFDEPGSKLRIKDRFFHHGNGKDHFICAMGAPFLKDIIVVMLGNVVETSEIGQVGKCHFHERQLLVHDFSKNYSFNLPQKGQKSKQKGGKGQKIQKKFKKVV